MEKKIEGSTPKFSERRFSVSGLGTLRPFIKSETLEGEMSLCCASRHSGTPLLIATTLRVFPSNWELLLLGKDIFAITKRDICPFGRGFRFLAEISGVFERSKARLESGLYRMRVCKVRS